MHAIPSGRRPIGSPFLGPEAPSARQVRAEPAVRVDADESLRDRPLVGRIDDLRGIARELAEALPRAAQHRRPVAESLEVAGFTIRSKIIWAKDRLVLSRGDYHWQHEPAWYAVRKSGKGHWAGDRKQTTLWQIANKDQDEKTVHGTQKPVECMRRPILNNSSPGQAVY